jgi:hypothetical protein
MELLLQKKEIGKYLKDECCYCFFFSVLFRSKKVDVHKNSILSNEKKDGYLKEDMCSSFMMFYCLFFFS